MKNSIRFENVSILITHYNRSESLLRLLSTIEKLKCSFHDVIVSDDCSDEIHVKRILEYKKKYKFQLIRSKINCGLGHNINKGMALCKSEYILYIQEDFVPYSIFPKSLSNALNILDLDQSIDIARFYAYWKYPYLKKLKEGFSLMNFKLTKLGYKKFYMYSDHPHLKRNSYEIKFGKYHENKNPEQTEYWMMMSFLKNKGKGLFYNNYQELFEHSNLSSEPSTMERVNWKRSDSLFIKLLREIYRTVKFNFDYLLRSKKG